MLRGLYSLVVGDPTPIVMVVGKSGMGKSTLCNYLLYSEPRSEDGFAVQPGNKPVTIECERKEVKTTPPPKMVNAKPGGRLAVIDTPGLPDPDGRTMQFYDKIVYAARDAGSLSALIVMVSGNADREHAGSDFKTYGWLLKHFNGLPCPKYLVYRMRMPENLHESARLVELSSGRAWITAILTEGGMNAKRIVILNEDEDLPRQVFSLRKELCALSPKPIDESCIQTSLELTANSPGGVFDLCLPNKISGDPQEVMCRPPPPAFHEDSREELWATSVKSQFNESTSGHAGVGKAGGDGVEAPNRRKTFELALESRERGADASPTTEVFQDAVDSMPRSSPPAYEDNKSFSAAWATPNERVDRVIGENMGMDANNVDGPGATSTDIEGDTQSEDEDEEGDTAGGKSRFVRSRVARGLLPPIPSGPCLKTIWGGVTGSRSNAVKEEIPTVMVVGKSGMGKSTLCNYLLYGEPRPDEGFEAHPGDKPVTSKCRRIQVANTPAPRKADVSPGEKMAVIDTPGLPDPAKRTLAFYDDIVMTARRTGSLSALIIMLCANADRDQVQRDFEMYSILLKQFNKLPCPKLVVCRMRMQEGLNRDQQEGEWVSVTKWIGHLLSLGGMKVMKIVILLEDRTITKQIFSLRRLLCALPPTPVGDWCMRTHGELQGSSTRLVDLATRKHELGLKKEELEKQLETLNINVRLIENKQKRMNQAGGVIGGVIYGVAVGATGIACGSFYAAEAVIASNPGIASAAASGAKKGFKLASNALKDANMTPTGVGDILGSIYSRSLEANREEVWRIELEIEEVDRERVAFRTNKDALERDRETLNELKKLAYSH